MKKILISCATAALFLAGACTQSVLDPLEGKFTAPTVVEYTGGTLGDAYTDEEGRRIFELDLTDGTTPLHATLVGNKYFLPANSYTEALEAVAKNGNFIIGKTTVGGKNVKQGTITVTLDEQVETDEGCTNTYTVKAVLFADDGTPYKLSWNGKLSFTKDPELSIEAYYTDTVSAAQNASWATIDGVEKHTLLIVDGEGNTLASAELVIATGGKLDGDYTCMSYPDKDHWCGNGYDLSAYGWGVGGTYYVSDGAYILVNEGEKINVADLGSGVYTITYPDGYSVTAAPQGYTPGANTLNTVMSVTNYYDMYSAWGMEVHLIGLELSDGKVTSSFDSATYSTTYSGEGDFLKLEFYTADGKVVPGVYTPCAVAGEVTEGTFGIGYTGDYGPGSGTNWVHHTAAGNEYENVLDGTLTIAYADGNFTFTLESSVVTATYTGPVEGLSVAGEEPGPEPVDEWNYTPGAAYKAAGNLWKKVDEAMAVEYFYYLNPNWGGEVYNNVASTECPFAEFKESTYKLTMEHTTYSRWENQFYIHPYGEANYIALDAGKTYKFSVTVSATQTFGAFFKLSQFKPEGAPKYEGEAIWEPAGYPDNLPFEAGKVITLEQEFTGVSAPSVNLIFDFGGAPEGTVIYIKDITLTEEGGEEPEYVALSKCFTVQDNSGNGVPSLTLVLASEGVSRTVEGWTTTWSGDGGYLSIDIYSADGTLAAGTYTASSEGGSVAEGQFGIGYDINFWGQDYVWGTTWNDVASGTVTTTKVLDGTVAVEKDGEDYVITLESSTVNARYSGKLVAE